MPVWGDNVLSIGPARRGLQMRGRAGGIVGDASYLLNGLTPTMWFDFVADRAVISGAYVGGVASVSGWSFTRATSANYHNLDGTLTNFSSGQMRRGARGLFLEQARTNLFLNSDTGATQDITVTAAAHTLSFYGTGTITLSGASTDGPLVGTGANNRVSLTFTPSAATLTCTVSGTCTNVQLELGNGASSYISTAGASVTRNADVASVSSPGVNYPLTLFVEYEPFLILNAGGSTLRMDNGTNNERMALSLSSGNIPRIQTATAGVSQADITIGGAIVTGAVYKHAAVSATNRVQAALNGTLGTEDTVATLPANPTNLRFGSNETGVSQPFVFIRRAAVFNTALSDANLQLITSS